MRSTLPRKQSRDNEAVDKVKYVLAGFGFGLLMLSAVAYQVLKFGQTYIICGKPELTRLTIDGREVELGKHGTYVWQELHGRHRFVATFKGGRSMEASLMPRLGDDNSTVVELQPDQVIVHGDMRYEIEKR